MTSREPSKPVVTTIGRCIRAGCGLQLFHDPDIGVYAVTAGVDSTRCGWHRRHKPERVYRKWCM